jgi:DNA polymerase III alpha subunit
MLDSTGKMYIEDNDIIELMLANRQAKILPRNPKSFADFESQCKTYGFEVPFKVDTITDEIKWLMPEEYNSLDIRNFILQQHKLNEKELQRVDTELAEFEQRNLVDLLRFLVYFVKIVRDNNIVYGVGRGSSVASYVLYLIGVHRINSLKYNLDIKEFLK